MPLGVAGDQTCPDVDMHFHTALLHVCHHGPAGAQTRVHHAIALVMQASGPGKSCGYASAREQAGPDLQ